MSRGLIIAIDGPAGSGKSTVAKLVAQKLKFLYVDTGAMYRALTLKAIKVNADLEDEEALAALAKKTDIELKQGNGSLKVYLDAEDVTQEIRKPEITNAVSYIARAKAVRAHMVMLQRRLGEKGCAVLEGRDIGTVVFPDADKKFYIDASFDVRVKRRYKELKEGGLQITEEEVKKDLKIRDENDLTRSIAPLKKADDAVYIDTSDMSIEGVVEKVSNLIKTK